MIFFLALIIADPSQSLSNHKETDLFSFRKILNTKRFTDDDDDEECVWERDEILRAFERENGCWKMREICGWEEAGGGGWWKFIEMDIRLYGEEN